MMQRLVIAQWVAWYFLVHGPDDIRDVDGDDMTILGFNRWRWTRQYRGLPHWWDWLTS